MDIRLSSFDNSEEWRQIKGADYWVSNMGRAKSKKKILKPRPGGYKNLYRRVSIGRNGVHKYEYIHRLVLAAFCGEPKKGYEASHINGDHADNRLENLKWESPKENSRRKIDHGTSGKGQANAMARLAEKEVIDIMNSYLNGISRKCIQKKYGVSKGCLSGILTRRTWKHLKVSKYTEKRLKDVGKWWGSTSNFRRSDIQANKKTKATP